MVAFPNAKINIGLYITEKRADGYHNLETIFYPIITAKDALEILDAKEDSFVFHGVPIVGELDQNLIYKALVLIRADYEAARKPVKIILYKNLPMGAGLGGGSADASFTIQLLNQHFQLNISEAQQKEYALTLGSDCPFFIDNTPSFAAGRGELLEPVGLNLSAYDIQLICPEIHISTAQAFGGIIPRAANYDLRTIQKLPITEWRTHIKNDFEATLFPQFPVLDFIKEQLYLQGAIYASLSGTGSTVYGIFPKGVKANIEMETPFRTF